LRDLENFRAIVADSDLLRERWLTKTSEIIAECEARYGEVLDRESLMQLTSVRLFVLTGDPDTDWKPEALQQLPALRRATELADLKRRIEEEDSSAVVSAEFDGLSPTEKMAKSRELGLNKTTNDRLQLSEEDAMREAAKINAFPGSNAQKLAMARAAGLTK